MVLFFHMGPHWALVPQLEPLSQLMRWGFSGVDVFFVLSGFVVYRSGVRSMPVRGFFSFIKQRFARIYTGYWAAFLLVTLISITVLNQYPKSTEQFLGSFFLLYPKFWDNWIAVAWSLTHELYFYFVLGLLLLVPKRHQTKAIVAAVLYFTVWNLGWLIFQTEKVLADAHPLRFIFGGFIVEFLVGSLIAILYDKKPDLFNKRNWAILACVAAIALGYFVGSKSYYFNQVEIMRAATYGLAAISMLVIAIQLEQSKIQSPKILVMIGDSSFSLYLLHSILLSVFGQMRHQYLNDQRDLWLIYSLVMPLVIIIISYFWYKYVEIKTIRLTRRI